MKKKQPLKPATAAEIERLRELARVELLRRGAIYNPRTGAARELAEDARRVLVETVLDNPYLPHQPTAKQAEFLSATSQECLYGGSAGGGKSESLLMAALQYVHVPNYAALVLRRRYADLSQPGALIPRSFDWLGGATAARWRGVDHAWEFPSGAVLKFGYLDGPMDKYQFQSAEFAYIGFDELTEFREADYRFMFSRLRKLVGVDVPLRMRSASNPGGPGHDWVKQRFIADGERAGRVFIPALIADNPHLNASAYRLMLANLDPVTRAQLEHGDWSARQAGSMFKREWFPIVAALPAGILRWVRYWDKACTREGTGSRTAGVLLGGIGSEFIVADVKIGRWSSSDREKIILQTAQLDRQRFGSVTTWVEQEPGSGGKESAEATIRNLAGYTIKAERVTGDKVSRAEPLACQASVGNVQLLRGDWNAEFIDELEAFPASALKDQVDAASGAFNKLALTNPLTAASQLMTGPLRPRTFAPRSLLNRGAIH